MARSNIYYNYYLAQTGNGLNHFSGPVFQRGNGLGSIFKSLVRFITPVFRPVGKAIGREALRTGSKIASDLLAGRNLRDTLKSNLREAGSNLLQKASQHIAEPQSGSGLRRKRKRSKPVKKRKRTKRDFLD